MTATSLPSTATSSETNAKLDDVIDYIKAKQAETG